MITAVSNEGAWGAIKALGVDPGEVEEIIKGLTSLKQMAGVDPQFSFNFPLKAGKPGRISKAFKAARNILGKSRLAQKTIGELGTVFAAKLIGLDRAGLKRPPNQVHGPDFVMRSKSIPAAFAIAEAKGGEAKLGRSGLKAGPWPSDIKTKVQLPKGGPFPQMGGQWLNWWLKKYIDHNTGPVADALKTAFFGLPPIPMLALVVSVNLARKPEVQVSFQPYIPPYNIGAWPKDFVGRDIYEDD